MKKNLLIVLSTLFISTNAIALPVVPPAECQKGRFQPCVCWRDVPKDVSYVPSSPLCRGNAAIILRGEFAKSFSVVVRDSENSDRFPDPNCALNSCSVFKVQKKIVRKVRGKTETVNCLGASGRSSLFKNVVRMTIKLKDVPNASTDPLARMCLRAPNSKLN